MIKYCLSTLLILLTLAASAQKKSVVQLIQSKSSELVPMNGKNVLKVYHGVFRQDYSTMRSDSAYFYVSDNAFDAFGNVNITQGDTLNIYSDKLNYNGNTKVAILTDNVKMIDKDAILTTNYLTYNTATRIGTYTGGGKLINKDNTLTSRNGYYFAFSRDAYFRYNVVLVTPDALIKTDTLRYNSGSRIAYFYGPTNIYDTKDKKDTLYTENGLYNTITEQAFFGKKNLYKQGTKTLTGDSLFYDKLQGYGRAVKRVTFHDREQNITLKGDLATYYKAGERTVVTQDPYVIIVTEDKDTTRRDTVPVKTTAKPTNATTTKAPGVKKADALAVKPPAGTMPVKNPGNLPTALNDTITVKAVDTLRKIANANKPAANNALKTGVKRADAFAVKPPPKGKPPVKLAGLAAFPMAKDTIGKKDTLNKKPIADKKVKRDSIYISADTLETRILTYKDYKLMLEQERLSHIRDTTVKAKKLSPAEQKKADKFLTLSPPKWIRDDTTYLHRNFFGKPKPQAPQKMQALGKAAPINNGGAGLAGLGKFSNRANTSNNTPAETERPADPDNFDKDPIFYVAPVTLADTARVRIIKAYHHAKLFKSDLQAKADSMFYSYSDSTLRCFVQPLIWTQGSQLSGDTITMRMKNKKLDNLTMFPSSFIVNIETGDSTHFNQIAGKRMRGFFKNDKLDRMFIVGNAETIYFSRDSLKRVDGMQRSLSSRMRTYFRNGATSNVTFLSKPEHRYGPLSKFTEDDKILKGFIWKPKDRPVSKESIIPSYNRKIAKAQAAADKKAADLNKGKPKLIGKDTLQNSRLTLPNKKAAGDSTNLKKQGIKPSTGAAKADSAATKAPQIKTSSSGETPKQDKTAVTTPPAVKPVSDSLKTKRAPGLRLKRDSVATKP